MTAEAAVLTWSKPTCGGDCTARLLEQVRSAIADRQPLRLRGGDTKAFLGRANGAWRGATPLDLRTHTGIVNYDPAELIMTARAGTPLAELEAALAEKKQALPCELPQFAAGATFGGAVAAGISGPRRPWAGAIRDFVLGTRLIDGHGRLLRFGGEVMKNVAGYDVSRLLTGSFGTLGVLTEISVKVLPRPLSSRTLRLPIGDTEALSRLTAWASEPLPITGACHDGEALVLRLEGGEGSVESCAARLGGVSVDDAYWTDLRDHKLPFFRGEAPLWRLSLPPATPLVNVPGAVGPVLLDWAGAQRWLRSDAPAAAIQSAAQAVGGHATCYHGGDSFHPLAPGILALHRRLKAQFDPLGLFNPGRLHADL